MGRRFMNQDDERYALECPHCHMGSFVRWTNWVRDMPRDDDGYYGAQFTTCPYCKRVIIDLLQIIPSEYEEEQEIRRVPIRPRSVISAIPEEVPEEYAAEFREACAVLPESPRASAALSRRCLQNVLVNVARATGGDLSKQIQDVIDRRLFRPQLADDLDAVRTVGNFAAHPIKEQNTGEIVPVEPEEAEWLITVIGELFVALFVEPTQAQARRDALNQKLASAGKPPLKQSAI